jgi:flagellar P-ring protein precursor FlgI
MFNLIGCRRYKHFRHYVVVLMTLSLLSLSMPQLYGASIQARIKDIARIDGLQSVELVGYGVVIGLNGTGDKDIELSKRTIANIVENFNIKLSPKDVKSKNVATVIVTASAPLFHKAGDKIDVQVSSIGDGSSLEGGILLMTPLLSPDGELYALAQGGVTVAGYSLGVAGPGGQTETKNHTTVGRVPNGAILQKSSKPMFIENGIMSIILNHADFTTATRIASVINEKYEASAVARDAGTVMVRIPDKWLDVGQVPMFISEIETLYVKPDSKSRVIINERTGTIVMGGDVHIAEAVVAHGNLTVRIGSTLTTYMPQSFTVAKPVTTEQITTETKEDKAKIVLIPGTTTVQELADMLNQVGSTPRDLISILEALQSLGALQMEVITM